MDDLTERLLDCFRTVLEDLSDEQIKSAVRGEVDDWDSLATLTLITVVEEEFGITLDDEAVESFSSFEAARSAVAQAAAQRT
jgi:acyl carrier protein